MRSQTLEAHPYASCRHSPDPTDLAEINERRFSPLPAAATREVVQASLPLQTRAILAPLAHGRDHHGHCLGMNLRRPDGALSAANLRITSHGVQAGAEGGCSRAPTAAVIRTPPVPAAGDDEPSTREQNAEQGRSKRPRSPRRSFGCRWRLSASVDGHVPQYQTHLSNLPPESKHALAARRSGPQRREKPIKSLPKLSDEACQELAALYATGSDQHDLAVRFGVSQMTISRALRGTSDRYRSLLALADQADLVAVNGRLGQLRKARDRTQRGEQVRGTE